MPKPGERYSHPDPATDEAMDWYMRLREEGDDAALRAEFEAWRRADESHAQAYERLERMHSMPSLRKAAERDAVRLGLRPALPAAEARPRRASRHRRWISALSAVAAALVVAIGIQQYPALILHLRADHQTVTGERQTIGLPDGSSVTLNTASAIAVDFKDGKRRVALLEGEAFFDVKRDAAHPFVVAGQFSEVEVKGTAFAVRRDASEDLVVLERGLVDVSLLPARREHAMLTPGQMVVATATSLSGVRAVDPARSLAWLDGRIVFYDRPFAQALADMKRYYRGSVILATGRLDGMFVNGNYRIDDPQAAIRTLAEAAGADVTRLPGGIIILR